MDTASEDLHATRRIPVGKIKVPSTHRRPSPKNVTGIAESIAEVGLLQAIGVSENEATGEYTLIYGGNRLAAHKKLGREFIEAKILDIDPADAIAAMHVENLFRAELATKERLTATAAWASHYKAKHPNSFGQAAMIIAATEHATQAHGAFAQRAKGDGESAEPRGDRPDVALAKTTGQSVRSAGRAIRVAETLTEPQREALADRDVSIRRMDQIVAIAEPVNRDKAINLIASGMDVATAIVVAQAPANATLEIVANPDADGYKPEAEMSDEEWFAAYCGESVAKLKYVDAYRASAILWRRTRQARQDFAAKTKKPLSQSKVGVKGPLHYLFARVVNVAHPKDWPFCGVCGGSGHAANVSKCPACNGNAFTLTSATN